VRHTFGEPLTRATTLLQTAPRSWEWVKTSMTRRKYYIDKRCTKMGGRKIVKQPNENKKVFYNISKDQSSKIR